MARMPRFRRAAARGTLQLTARDLAILREVARYRFLNSHQIMTLVGGSEQHVRKRLQRLFHGGYLDRPRAQLRYFSEEGPQPMVYALSRKGAREVAAPEGRPRYDNRTLKQFYLQHTLLVAEVMIAFARACEREDAPRLLLEEDLAADLPPGVAFHWSVTVRYGEASRRVGVWPDRAFALEKNGERILYFIEADRATMPVTRASLAQTSMLRKLLAYEATWERKVQQERFGFDRFRVLTVTDSPERAQHLAFVAAGLPRGRGLFLFTDIDTLRGEVVPYSGRDVLELLWLDAHGGHERLIDSFV